MLSFFKRLVDSGAAPDSYRKGGACACELVGGVLLALLPFLILSGCAANTTKISSVRQGGIDPLPPPGAPAVERKAATINPPVPMEEVAPREEETAAVVTSPAVPAENPIETAHAALDENIPVEEAHTSRKAFSFADRVPVELSPLPDVTVVETEPSPELVGPNDEELLQTIEDSASVEPPAEVEEAKKIEYDLPLELNSTVLKYVELFQTSRRESFARGLSRSKIYEAEMKDIFRAVGVPTDLYYLALIESAFNPRAYSRAHASGVWQFISSTGKMYGLHRNHWKDERRDPVKSATAAARHLKDLHEEFKSWPLALAAYNAGQGRVSRAIRKAGTRDFWKLSLPSQTRNYVPAFYAALIICKDPETYGFDVDYELPVVAEQIEVEGGTRLSLVASLAHVSLQEIRNLNPELRQSCCPPGSKYMLNVPPGKGGEVVAELAKLPRQTVTGGSYYLIRSGDTLSTIARRFGTTVPAIQEVNNLAGHFIRAGKRLMIPGGQMTSRSIPRDPEISLAIPSSGTYRVRQGDNLWMISRRFGLSLEKLMSLNSLTSRDVLQIGQTLTLKGKSGTRTAAAGSQRELNSPTYYKVRKGDNIWRIARKFDTDIKTILRANDLRASEMIYPGDRLIIPRTGSL